MKQVNNHKHRIIPWTKDIKLLTGFDCMVLSHPLNISFYLLRTQATELQV